MDCNLKYKGAKDNALHDLTEKGFIVGTRVLPLDKREDFQAYHTSLVAATNLNYGLDLPALFTIVTNTINDEFGSKMNKKVTERVEPIEEAFNTLDKRRQEMGIYEEQISIGEYNKKRREEKQEGVIKLADMIQDVFGKKDMSIIDNYAEDGLLWTKKTIPLSQIKLGNHQKFSEEEKIKYSESLSKNGQQKAGIVDKNGVLSDGYHRYYSLQQAGIDSMVVYVPFIEDSILEDKETQEEAQEEAELVRLRELREASQAANQFLGEDGNVYPTAEEAMRAQEEDFNDNITAGNFDILQPHYSDYLRQKEEMLAKVERLASKLYNERRETPSVEGNNKLRRILKVKSGLEQDIKDYVNAENMDDLISKFLREDLELIERLVANPTLDNLFLAKDVYAYLARISKTTNKENTLLPGRIDNNRFEPVIEQALLDLNRALNDSDSLIDNAMNDVFLSLLERQRTTLATMYPDLTMVNPAGNTVPDMEAIKKEILRDKPDISTIESFFFTAGENVFTTDNNILDDLMVFEFEKASIREAAKAKKIIADIDAEIAGVEKELDRLGLKITGRAGKHVYSGYDYGFMYQKDAKGNVKSSLVGKYAKTWEEAKKEIDNEYNAEIVQAKKDKNWAEVERLLDSKYSDTVGIGDFVDISLLHDLNSGQGYTTNMSSDTAAAAKYKADLIARIGQEEYEDLIDEQKFHLESFDDEMSTFIQAQLMREGVTTYSQLSDDAKDSIKATEARISPFTFNYMHHNHGTNKVEVKFGTQSSDKPSHMKYNSFIPRQKDRQGKDTNFYDKRFDMITNTPVFYSLWKALRKGSGLIAENFIDSDVNVGSSSIMFMEKQVEEIAMDRTHGELVVKGLGHLLNLKRWIKDVLSAQKPDFNYKNEQASLAGGVATIDSKVNSDFKILRTDLANIFGKNYSLKTKVEFDSMPFAMQQELLQALGETTRDGLINKVGKEDANGRHLITMSEFRLFSERRVMEQQTMNLPLLMKALLEVSAEHRARTTAKNEMNVYREKSRSIKNSKAKKDNKTGGERFNEIKRQDFWYDNIILNRTQKDLGGSTSEWLSNKFGGQTYQLIGEHFYKSLTPEEKLIYKAAKKRIKAVEAEIAASNKPGGTMELVKEREELESRMRMLGKDYMMGALLDNLVSNLAIKVGLNYNILANIRNRTQGFIAMLSRDGEFWGEGNIYPVNHFMTLNKTRFMNKQYAEEWNKMELYIRQLGRLQDGTNELQKAESSIKQKARWFSPMYGTQVVEFYNQSSGILAMSMDVMVKDVNGNEFPIFDGTKFPIYKDLKDTGGKLQLKDEFRTPENIASYERMDSEDMTLWKTEVDNMTKSLAGDYSHTGVTRVKGNIITKTTMLFKTWLTRFISSRLRYKQKNIRTGQEETGYLLSSILNPKTSVAGSLIFAATGALGLAGSLPLAITGLFIGAGIAKGYAMRRSARGPSLPVADLMSVKEQVSFLIKHLIPVEMPLNAIRGKKIMARPTFKGQDKLTPQELKDLRLVARNMQISILLMMLKLGIQAFFQDNEEDEPQGEAGSAQRLLYEEQQKDKKAWKAAYNFTENMVSGMYQEVSLILDLTTLTESVISKNGLQNNLNKLAGLTVSLMSPGTDEIQRGERKYQSKTVNKFRKFLLPALVRDIGNDTWRGGFEGTMETEYDPAEWIDSIFHTDYRTDKADATEKRGKIVHEYIKEWEKTTGAKLEDQDLELQKSIKKAARAAGQAASPNPGRELYDEDQEK